jgi:hypothetical protein
MSETDTEVGERTGADTEADATTDEGDLLDSDASLNRKQAALAVAPFVALGLADVVLLLFWGLDPLWGFVILPPILFVSVLGWIGFRSGFIADRSDAAENDTTAGASDPDPESDDLA